jgi:cyclophilin family peptidyl-prolyl cis-trans isomerase
MRFLPSLLALVIAQTALVGGVTPPDPVTSTAIPTKSIVSTVGTPPIDLRNYFAIPSITGQVVQFTTPAVGVFNVEMKAGAGEAPNTVANFLSYVNAGSFTNSLIHRSVPISSGYGYGILQGGSFLNTIDAATGGPKAITTNAPIAMEAGDALPHSAGTIAMARTTNPNSATSGWFINVTDNSATWAPASSGSGNSYAVFGRVTGTGMTVVNAIAALPVLGGNVVVQNSNTGNAVVTVDALSMPANFGAGWILLGSQVQSVNGNFVTLSAPPNANISTNTTVPYTLFSDSSPSPLNALQQLPVFTNLASASDPLYLSNLVTESTIAAVPIFPATPGGPSVVTFSAVSSNPGLVNATISGSNLYIAAATNLTSSATVTVTATDSNGNAFPAAPFTVNVTRKVLDFNADGNPEFLFQNTAGQILAWYMTQTGSVSSSAYIYTGGLGDWKLRCTADMNGDGNPDFLFQNSYGQIYVWYMTAAGSVSSSAYIYAGGLGDWRLAGATDLNRDGKTDLILQNTAGQIYAWFMNGSGSISSTGFVYSGGLGDWKLSAIADMNSDGIPDFILQNSYGQIYVWYMSLTGSVSSGAYIYAGGLGDWKVAVATDLNKDGKTDLILQNTIGQVYAWYMNGNGAISSTGLIYGGATGDWRMR